MKATLVIMAAGMGSRYGGEKQTDGVGPNGEIIMEYSIYDAVKAGFEQIVFIIKPDMLERVKSICGDRISRMKAKSGNTVEVSYVFQDFACVPEWYEVPADRVKPFGTVHATLCAKDIVTNPFALINADDYYGREAYQTIYEELNRLAETGEATMVGYELKNTVSENGTVTRGLCMSEEGKLNGINETYQIKLKENGEIVDAEDPNVEKPLDPSALVSMNFWGFTPWIFEEMSAYFDSFLHSLSENELKAECLLPSLVDALMKTGELSVSVLKSEAKWIGVTYQEDRENVVNSLAQLHQNGVYPESIR